MSEEKQPLCESCNGTGYTMVFVGNPQVIGDRSMAPSPCGVCGGKKLKPPHTKAKVLLGITLPNTAPTEAIVNLLRKQLAWHVEQLCDAAGVKAIIGDVIVLGQYDEFDVSEFHEVKVD